MWRTNKNKSVYLKGAAGWWWRGGGSSEEKLHKSDQSWSGEWESVTVVWSDPVTSPSLLLATFYCLSFICELVSIISADLKSWLKLRKTLPRNESFPWQHTAVLQFCVALQDVRTFSFSTLPTWTCSRYFSKRVMKPQVSFHRCRTCEADVIDLYSITSVNIHYK